MVASGGTWESSLKCIITEEQKKGIYEFIKRSFCLDYLFDQSFLII